MAKELKIIMTISGAGTVNRRIKRVLSTGLLLALCCVAARAEIVIGVAAPLSGQFSVFGEDIQLGVNLAVAKINAAGGVSGEPLRVVTEDDKCSEAGGRDAANRLIGAKVQAVIGHVCWRASIAGSALYQANGIVQISPATRYGKFTDERPDPQGGTYRLIGRSEEQVKFLTKMLPERFAGQRIAIVHDNSPYGKGVASALQSGLAATGVRDILFAEYEPGKNQYKSLASTITDAVAEVVFVGGYYGDAAVIVRDMRARGMAAPLVGADALAADEFWSIAGPAAEGVIFSAPWDPRKSEPAGDLVSLIAARGQAPQIYTITAYAAVEILAAALEPLADRSYAALNRALNETAFDTVLGRVRFDARGDADLPAYAAFQWRAGKVVPLVE